jgi:hypothetical protein
MVDLSLTITPTISLLLYFRVYLMTLSHCTSFIVFNDRISMIGGLERVDGTTLGLFHDNSDVT